MNFTDYNPKEYCYISLCVNRKLPNNSGVSLFAENISDFVLSWHVVTYYKKRGHIWGHMLCDNIRYFTVFKSRR